MNGAKNLLYVPNGQYVLSSNSSVTVSDGTLIYNSTTSDTTAKTLTTITLDAGTYVMMNRQVKPSASSGSVYADLRLLSGSTNLTTGEPATFTLDTAQTLKVTAMTYSSVISDMSIKPMIITKAAYDAGFRDYQHYALSNVEITPALIECVDGGAKNVLQYNLESIKSTNTDGTWSANVYTYNGVKYTVNSDLTITLAMVSGTTTHSRSVFWITKNVSNKYTQTYVLSGGNTTASTDSFSLSAEETANPWTNLARDYEGTGAIISATSQSTYGVYIGVKADYVISSTQVIKPMICTKAAWDVSQKFVPYRYTPVDYPIVFTVTTLSTTYTKVGTINFGGVPSGTVARISVGLSYTNVSATGIKILRATDDLFVDEATQEATAADQKYLCLNTFIGLGSIQTFDVYVKTAADKSGSNFNIRCWISYLEP